MSMKAERRILIVDDEPALVKTMSIVLRSAKYRASTVNNGVEAIEALETAAGEGDPFELVVTDVQMPRMTGEELIDEIRNRGIQVRILVITGYGSKELVVGLMRKGCDEYIDKPFTGKEFLDRVNDLFARTTDRMPAEQSDSNRVSSESVRLEREVATYKESFEKLRRQVDSAVGAYHSLVHMDTEHLKVRTVFKSLPLADLGGDYAQVCNTPEGCDVVLADVAGHDMGASFHTVLIKSFFEENCRKGKNGEDFFAILNQALTDTGAQRMVTAQFLRINLVESTVQFVSAAHLPATVIPAFGSEIYPLHVPGSVLGVLENVQYESKTVRVAPGDRILMYSDGLPSLARTDGPSGRALQLAPVGIDSLIRQYRRESLRLMTDRVWSDALAFARYKATDDVVLLVMEIPEI